MFPRTVFESHFHSLYILSVILSTPVAELPPLCVVVSTVYWTQNIFRILYLYIKFLPGKLNLKLPAKSQIQYSVKVSLSLPKNPNSSTSNLASHLSQNPRCHLWPLHQSVTKFCWFFSCSSSWSVFSFPSCCCLLALISGHECCLLTDLSISAHASPPCSCFFTATKSASQSYIGPWYFPP